MFRSLALAMIVGVTWCLAAGSSVADRLILIPTGTTLTTGGIKGEFAASSERNDAKAYWVNVGMSRFEVEGARFQDFGADDVDAVGVQVSVLPETTFTPAIALGVRDISDETGGKGVLYDGQSFYLAVSKAIPVTGGVPILFKDMKMHGGVGTGSLGGIFFGVEGTLPIGIRLAGEYDTDDFNLAASYSIIPALRVRASSIKRDFYYGVAFATSF